MKRETILIAKKHFRKITMDVYIYKYRVYVTRLLANRNLDAEWVTRKFSRVEIPRVIQVDQSQYFTASWCNGEPVGKGLYTT